MPKEDLSPSRPCRWDDHEPLTTYSEKKKPIGGELIIPLLAIGFTGYYFSTIIDSPWTAQVNAVLVGSALCAVILVFLVRSARELIEGRATLGLGSLLAPTRLLPRRAAFAGLTVAYVFLIQWGGFTLTTFAFLALSMILLGRGRRPLLSVGLAALMALVGYALFIAAFDTRFPKGPFEWLVEAVI